MLFGYTGTPGAGKTLHMLNAVYNEIKRLSTEHFQFQKYLSNLRYVFKLRWLIRLVRSLHARGVLPIIPYRKIWRKFFAKLVAPKEQVVPVIFINIDVNLEWWKKEFPHVDFRFYPKENDTLYKLIGDYPDYKHSKCPVFPSLWVFDELQMFFPKTSSSAKPNKFEQFFEKHRHYGVNMYFTTQSMSLTSHHIRQLVETQIHITNPFRTGLVRIQEHVGAKTSPREREAKAVRQATAPKKIFEAYTSSQKHIEKKGYPWVIKVFLLGVVLYVVGMGWWILSPTEVPKSSSQTPPPKPLPPQPQQLGVPQFPIEAKPKPVDQAKTSLDQQVAADIQKKKAEMSGSGGVDSSVKTTGWKVSEDKNPFSEWGVSDPSHVSFHGVAKLGKTAYRMCFYVKNFFCAWVELPDDVKVRKFFTTTMLFWKDWAIPQTPEGMHSQIVSNQQFNSSHSTALNDIHQTPLTQGLSSIGQVTQTSFGVGK